MTKFEDQLFADLMHEHRSTLAHTRLPAPPSRHVAARRTLVLAGAGGLGVAAAAGALVATSGGSPAHVASDASPAYAVTTHPDGTVTLAVYQASGIAGANQKLHRLGDQVVVVPVRAGCQPIGSLRPPKVAPHGHPSVSTGIGHGGSVTVNAKGIPAGDILVVGVETTTHGRLVTSLGAAKLTSAPAPSCVSLPSAPLPPAGSESSAGSVSGNG
jgi:hypothetical protein